MIRELHLATLKRRWSAVFASNDPFTWPFHEGFVWSGVFFPTEGYHVFRRQFAAGFDGSAEFGRVVCEAYGAWDEDLQRLRAEWSGNPRGAWVSEMEKRVGWG
ncbi:MAG: hypothetical protein U0625_12185 [Phycisphaerales bacterium]